MKKSVPCLTKAVSCLTVAVLSLGARAGAAPIAVNCDRGQSLSRALAQLPRGNPSTVTVTGTCTEYVSIRGMEDVTVRSTTGATIVQPPSDPGQACLYKAALTIDASRRITIAGLKVKASLTDPCSGGIFVRGGSADVRLRQTEIEGGNQCVSITQNSQVSLAGVTGHDASWAAVGVFDGSSVHIEDSLFEGSSEPGWHEGIVAMNAVAVVHGTVVRNMQVGLNADSGGVIDLSNLADYYPTSGPSDVVVESPAGTNFYGVSVRGGSSFHAGVKLRITTPGQWWGGDSGGVRVSGSSSFDAWGTLEVVDSYGQGVFVGGSSFANVPGAVVTGTDHGGLVVVHSSSANLDAWNIDTTPITGSGGADLFCDATSVITGGNKATGSSRQCDHVVDGGFGPLP